MSNIIIFPLSNGHNAFIDSDDLEKVSNFKWYARKGKRGVYYATSTLHKNVHMHRLILGVTDRKVFVDHKDHNGLNNTKENLRAVTNSQNMMNSRPNKNTTSKYKGVYWAKDKGKWTAQIKINSKMKYIGRFHIEDDAAIAYNEMAKEYFGEYAYINQV